MAANAPATRAAGPDVFHVAAADHNTAAESDEQAIRLSNEGLATGAAAADRGAHPLGRIAAMADARSPATDHVGLIVNSMGSGSGCVGQDLSAEDILGTPRRHDPRHA